MNEIPTRDRIMALLSPPSQDAYLCVEDARWVKAEIERLQAENDRLDGRITELQAEAEIREEQLNQKIKALQAADAENERLQQEFINKAGEKAMQRITQLQAENEMNAKQWDYFNWRIDNIHRMLISLAARLGQHDLAESSRDFHEFEVIPESKRVAALTEWIKIDPARVHDNQEDDDE